jgi:carboxylate-amine ligase
LRRALRRGKDVRLWSPAGTPLTLAAVEIAFRPSERGSLGIEMELSIVERGTRGLVCAASEVLETLGRRFAGGEHPRAKHELFESTIEIVTGVCSTVTEARADLAATLAEVAAELDGRGLAILSAGTHPFSHWHEQKVSPSLRYHRLVEDLQWPARRLSIYGTHFHVGVESGARAVAIVDSLAHFLPVLLALSAASPFWHGIETGMASCRTKVFEALPTAGLPPRLGSWRDFERLMQTLVAAGAVETIREVWWDIRPHPDFGTVELRMCDAMPTLRETTALAAMAQSLVVWLDGLLDEGKPLPASPEWVVRQNKWLAARYGLEAEIIAGDHGARRPTRDLVADLVATLEPTAKALGCAAELDEVRAILARGPSYARQRRVLGAGGNLVDVVDSLVRELATDEPTTP